MLAGVACPGGLEVVDVDLPTPGDFDLLVKVASASLNRADLFAAQALRDNAGQTVGMEWAGTVVEIGSKVSWFGVGDRVVCSGNGGYAEYACCPAVRAIAMSPELSFDEAAVLPLALMTAHNALIVANMKEGANVLVHGASSGVGLATIRIAQLLGANLVAATSRNADNRERLRDFGANPVVDPANGWASALKGATAGHGADVIVDLVTGPGLNETMRAAALLGRIVNVGRLGGMAGEIDLDFHALKRLSLIGVTFRTRTMDEVAAIVRGVAADLWRHVESGELRLPIDSVFPLGEAPAALARMARNEHFGKIVLRVA
jgi:NADPH:quinone reductase